MHSVFFAVKMRHLACWESFFISGFLQELTQQRRRWQRKRHLKSKYALLQTL